MSEYKASRCVFPAARPAIPVGYDIAEVTKELKELFEECQCQPIMVRLAWHDAGTYSKWDGSGGPSGSIRFMPEAGHGANAGLRWAMNKLESIATAHPGLTYADLYQLAGVVAVKTTGGPDIPFRGKAFSTALRYIPFNTTASPATFVA